MKELVGRWARDGRGLLLVVVLAGLLLRLFHLGHQSLWFDESLTVTHSRLPLGEIAAALVHEVGINTHPPLHFYMLHSWFALFGVGAYQARLLSAVVGTLSLVMIYILAKYLFDQRTALLSAMLLAVSQLGILYSQEARPYALLLLLVLLSIYLFLVALREGRPAAWWSFVGSSILVGYAHYYGSFVVACLLGYAALYRRRYRIPLAWLIGGVAVILLLYGPWVTVSALRFLDQRSTLLHEWPVWFATDWTTFSNSIHAFNNGRVSGVLEPRASGWTHLLGGLLFTLPALLGMKPLVRKPGNAPRMSVERENLVFLMILWILPALPILVGMSRLLSAPFDIRYLAHCIGPYYILVAHGLSVLNSSLLRRVIVFGILVYSGFSLRANYFMPYKENYRDALAHLAREHREGDCTVFLPFGEVPLEWSIYQGDHPGLRVVSLDAVLAGQTECERVWVVLYLRSGWVVQDHVVRKMRTTLTKVDERHYFWVDVVLYRPKSGLDKAGR